MGRQLKCHRYTVCYTSYTTQNTPAAVLDQKRSIHKGQTPTPRLSFPRFHVSVTAERRENTDLRTK